MSLEQAETGFIGLGAMGGGIARRLAQAGVKLHVCDLDPAKTAAFAQWNVVVHPTPHAVAEAVEVVHPIDAPVPFAFEKQHAAQVMAQLETPPGSC